MMRILHTSDWHLGQIFYGYDRTAEYLDFFNQLKRILEDYRPDAMLVSGDIFDVSSPSASVMKMFTDCLLEIHNSFPDTIIVVTSGNHDSASRIDVNRNLWKSAGIHVIGNVRRNGGIYDFNDNIIRVGDKGYIVAIPYINRAFMAPQDDSCPQEKRFFDSVSVAIEKIEDHLRLPIVLMAHLTVADCDMKGHRCSAIGNINSVSRDVFSPVFDYVALGHIHRPQDLTPDRHIRYSGSPLSINFDEEYPHSVSIVDVEKDGISELKEIEIRPIRSLLTFPEEPADFTTVIKKLKRLRDDDNSYIRLNVMQDENLPSDCQEIAINAMSDKQCRFCMIRLSRINTGDDDMEGMRFSREEFSRMTPVEVASRFFSSCGLTTPQTSEYLTLLSYLEEELKAEKAR